MNIKLKKALVVASALLVANASQLTPVLAQEDTDTSSQVDVKGSLTVEDYQKADASTLAQMVREGKVTSQELIELAFEVIEATEGSLNNLISTRKEAALEEAKALEDTGQPFYGVPILLKGLGHTYKDGFESLGIEFLKDQKASEDSEKAKAFREAGFIVIGQTNYPQLGWINVTNSDLYGATHNPWKLDHNPGGSSGGSAAAVVVGQVPIASTSDGGGSTRIPASWSGLIGLHPSRAILRWDEDTQKETVTNFAETKTMADTKALFDFLVKDDQRDSLKDTPLDEETRIAYTTQTPAGTPIFDDAVAAVEEAVAFLKDQGYQVEEVDYPTDGQKLMEKYYVLAASGAGFLNDAAQGALGRDLEMDDVERLTWGLYQTSQDLTDEDLEAAWDYADQVRDQLEEFFTEYDVLLTPTNSYPAPEADYNHLTAEMAEKMADMSGLTKEEKLQLIYDQWLPAWTLTPYTQLANLTGTPAISLPTYVNEEGLPLGIMFHTSYKNDRLLLELGQAFEDGGQFKLFDPADFSQP